MQKKSSPKKKTEPVKGHTVVFFHGRSPGKHDWQNEFRNFSRVPMIGEHVALESNDRRWFRVYLVVHTPFPCDCSAEVYGVAVDHLEALKDVHGT